jgi:tetratricopeptide (TPR) repeat protein
VLKRLLAGGRAVWFYLFKDIVPAGLMPVYPRWDINARALAAWLPGLLWLALLGFLGLALWKKRASSTGKDRFLRATFGGLLFFTVTLAPALGPIQISYFFNSQISDHLQYLPLAGLCSIAGFAASSAAASALNVRFIGGAVIAVLGFLSWQRAGLYGQPENLWRDNVAKNPNAAMAWSNLAGLISGTNREEAIDYYEKSVALDPRNGNVRVDYASLLAAAGQTDKAMHQFEAATALQPRNPFAHNGFGAVLGRMGQLDAAVNEFKLAVDCGPGFAEAHRNLGMALYLKGENEAAIRELETALKISPGLAGVEAALAKAQARAQRSPGMK